MTVSQGPGRSGDFVDARNLAGEDFVSKTLEETTGTLGGNAPEGGDFSARAKERRKRANVRVALRVLIAVVSVAVGGAGMAAFSRRCFVWKPARSAYPVPTNG